MSVINLLQTVDLTIGNAGSLSDAANLDGMALIAVITPVAWTAAALTFKKSADSGANYYPVYDKNGEISVVSSVMGTAERRWVDLDPALFINATHVKVQSGLNGSAVAQGGARTITLVFRPLA